MPSAAAVQEVKTESGVVKYYVHSVFRHEGKALLVFIGLPDKNLMLMFAVNQFNKVVIPPLKEARRPLDSSSKVKTDYRVGGDHLYPTLVKVAGAILH